MIAQSAIIVNELLGADAAAPCESMWNPWNGHVACDDPAEYWMSPQCFQVFSFSMVAQLRDVTPSPSAILSLPQSIFATSASFPPIRGVLQDPHQQA